MKRLAINALLLDPQAGGIAVYIKNLIDGFLKQENQEWRPFIFARHEAMRTFGYTHVPAFCPVRFSNNPIRRVGSELLSWRRLLKKYRIDLLHVPISYYLPNGGVPTIITVHDLRVIHDPQSYVMLRRIFLQKAIPWAAYHAVHLIAVSEFTKNELIKHLHVPAEKVTVVYSGVNSDRFSVVYGEKEKDQVRRKYRLPDQFVLAVGHLEPRKNYERLIAAFGLLRRQGVIRHLVVVGRENWRFQSIYEQVRRLDLNEAVHFTRFVDPMDLPIIYQSAQAFVAPSLFEGFGFTPLEAMAAGIPVAASNTTSHPEVCGNAALYFDPLNINDMAEKIAQLLTDLEVRKKLIALGQQRIARFSWQQCWKDTFTVYRKCLENL